MTITINKSAKKKSKESRGVPGHWYPDLSRAYQIRSLDRAGMGHPSWIALQTQLSFVPPTEQDSLAMHLGSACWMPVTPPGLREQAQSDCSDWNVLGWDEGGNHIVRKWWIRETRIGAVRTRPAAADEASIAGLEAVFSWGLTGLYRILEQSIPYCVSTENRVLQEWGNRTAGIHAPLISRFLGSARDITMNHHPLHLHLHLHLLCSSSRHP